ncbi:hypothetical protein [Oceanobacillus sp. J11TS1]|uniref:hypothetical protein n=1 Tax=Oceanobacillus sp. J11TS1 TaxID=2807191 RepID=UPI001B0AB9A2|nr:hypothetical protein [Oceanobacillus sp. J11TS1]GIO21423.1 hypothetical protein J11TS1_00040 [Oceanobacillus sp. J11TS1]
MEKKKNGIFIFLGICILIAGGFIGGGLTDVADSINQYEETDDSFRMIVQDGTIYMYETTSGQVWRKADNLDSKWEEVEYFCDE